MSLAGSVASIQAVGAISLTLTVLATLEHETGNFSQGEAHLEALIEIIAQASRGAATYHRGALVIPYAGRENGTMGQHTIETIKRMSDHPEPGDQWFWQAMAAALQKLNDEKATGAA